MNIAPIVTRTTASPIAASGWLITSTVGFAFVVMVDTVPVGEGPTECHGAHHSVREQESHILGRSPGSCKWIRKAPISVHQRTWSGTPYSSPFLVINSALLTLIPSRDCYWTLTAVGNLGHTVETKRQKTRIPIP